MKIVFVSNYFNHHQQPVSMELDRLCREDGGSYTFIQTAPMEEERVKMGWGEVFCNTPYLTNYWENPARCQELIDRADAVIFGGTDEECYIQNRLRAGRTVWRYSERLYKTGRYKFISPRGLYKKFLDHTRYAGKPVYLLCSGAYVAGDFRLVLAYPGRKFRYGYFPAFKEYDLEQLMQGKSYRRNGVVQIFWAARMIDWKHPELPVKLAAYLKEKGKSFRLLLAGDGVMRSRVEALADKLGVTGQVRFLGSQNPDKVRHLMEESDIYIATSDYGEGWGAVINEAMNSGCAVVANRAMGAVPYLINSGVNGYDYPNAGEKEFFSCVQELLEHPEQREQMGRAAYERISGLWNAQVAADRLYTCIKAGLAGDPIPCFQDGPLSRI